MSRRSGLERKRSERGERAGRSLVARHKVMTTLLALVLLGAVGNLADEDEKARPEAESSEATTGTVPSTATPARSSPSQGGPARTARSPRTPAAPRRTTPRSIPNGAQPAVVTSITDGDTLHVRAVRAGRVLRTIDDFTVRLLEIDTPETVDPSQAPDCYGAAATRALARLAPVGSTVWVLPDQDLLDPYGRTLLYLWSVRGGRARFVNLEMVRGGWAKAVLYEPNDRYIDAMRAAEHRARALDRGLWEACPFFGAPLAGPHPTRQPRPFAPPRPGRSCDSSYPGVCIPPYPPDLDCGDVPETGFRVRGDDPHGFDADGDGIACDSG